MAIDYEARWLELWAALGSKIHVGIDSWDTEGFVEAVIAWRQAGQDLRDLRQRIRVIEHGNLVTDDYVHGRITVYLDEDGSPTRIMREGHFSTWERDDVRRRKWERRWGLDRQ